ncbi:MAG: hypothetical protein ACRD12_19600, partial [Acidimicrobiales bacterium]
FNEADRQLARTLDALAEADNYAEWIVEMAEPYLGADILERYGVASPGSQDRTSTAPACERGPDRRSDGDGG